MFALGYTVGVTVEELRSMGVVEHRDEQGRPVLKVGERIVSRGFTMEQFVAHKTVADKLLEAQTEQDYIDVCVLFLREMQQKQHPLTNETGKEINFYINALFHDKADAIWDRAWEIVR